MFRATSGPLLYLDLERAREHASSMLLDLEIFNLDLNTLISMDVELEMMYHTTVSRK